MIFVEGDVVFGEEIAEFFFEGFGAVVFALVLDVIYFQLQLRG